MIREIIAKTVIQKSRLPESPYCLNPYIGCNHRCSYCYARFMRRFTGHSNQAWGSFVDVKINAPEVLANQLGRTQIDGTVLIGSVCDAYQSIEKRYGITRACIQQLAENDIPFSVLTKSSLVLRDLDIVKIAGKNVSVGISLAMLDDSIRRRFEPGASSIHDRLSTLQELHTNGIKTYIFIGPILPMITDIQAIIDTAGSFVDEVWGETLNIRCGNWSDLDKAYKACGLSDKWQKPARSKQFWEEMAKKMKHACQSANISQKGFYMH